MNKPTSYLRGCAKIYEYFHSGSTWNLSSTWNGLASNSSALLNANGQNSQWQKPKINNKHHKIIDVLVNDFMKMRLL